MLNRQEAFDIAVKGVIAQGCASVYAGGCAYRGYEGKKCAVGFLIPDEDYSPAMEGKRPYDESFDDLVRKLGWTNGDRLFLSRLQSSTHDAAAGASGDFIDVFKRRAKAFAVDYGLKADVLEG